MLLISGCGSRVGNPNNNNQNSSSDRCPPGYLLVPGGTFTMGVDAEDVADLEYGDWDSTDGPAHTVTLSSDFCMSKTEITVSEYRVCREAGDCTGEGPLTTGQDDRCNFNPSSNSRDDHPVNCLTQDQAREYCGVQGGDLPSEAQWMRAAQGDDRRPYSWGTSAPTCSRTNFDVNGSDPEDENGWGCAKTILPPYTWPVGSGPAGASPYGLLDMTGNVSEYVLGCRHAMEVCDGELGCVDPLGYECDDSFSSKMLAGSGAKNRVSFLYLFERSSTTEEQGSGHGMRCAVPTETR